LQNFIDFDCFLDFLFCDLSGEGSVSLALHSLAKSPFVKTSGERRYSAFLRRVGPLTKGL
jgi:hypothetical protein